MAGERLRIRALEQRVGIDGIDRPPEPIIPRVPVTTDHVRPGAFALLHRLYRLKPQTVALFRERERILDHVEAAAASGDDETPLIPEVEDIEQRIGPPRLGDIFIDAQITADHAGWARDFGPGLVGDDE